MDSIAAHNMIMYLSINKVLHLVLGSEHKDLKLIVTIEERNSMLVIIQCFSFFKMLL